MLRIIQVNLYSVFQKSSFCIFCISLFITLIKYSFSHCNKKSLAPSYILCRPVIVFLLRAWMWVFGRVKKKELSRCLMEFEKLN